MVVGVDVVVELVGGECCAVGVVVSLCPCRCRPLLLLLAVLRGVLMSLLVVSAVASVLYLFLQLWL